MATSVVEIINIALNELGVDTITSLTDDNESARTANLRWPIVRDAVLRAHPWNCCMTQAELAADSTDPAWKWDAQYTMPSNCLRLCEVASSAGIIFTDYEVQGRKILTNEAAPIYISYVKREEDPTIYDQLLSKTLAAAFAMDTAYKFTASTTAKEAMTALYERYLSEARGVDAQEGTTRIHNASNWRGAKLGNYYRTTRTED